VGALCGDGLLAAVLGNEVALGALHEVLLELSGQGVPVRVGVLLQRVLAELRMLAIELQSGVLIDCQGLCWP